MNYEVSNFSNFEALFDNFLTAENIASFTKTNYLSDLRYYFGWIQQYKAQNITIYTDVLAEQAIRIFTKELIDEYKQYMISSEVPFQTINRRLSALRKFCSLCISQGWIKENIAKQVMNAGTTKKLNASSIDVLLNEYTSSTVNMDTNTQKNIQEFVQIINL